MERSMRAFCRTPIDGIGTYRPDRWKNHLFLCDDSENRKYIEE